MSDHNDALPPEAYAYYERGREAGRLESGTGRLEALRTRELIRRNVPDTTGTIYDVGGGAGIHAFWLAEQGYDVHLLDAVPLHIEQAHARNEEAEHQLASAVVGDARELPWDDASADAVLMLGPLYHIVDRDERVLALTEARRVVKPGGVVLAAVISRFASALDGLWKGYLADPAFKRIAAEDLKSGHHRNQGSDSYFTTTYFHHPDEVAAEMTDAGLQHEATLGIEGPGWLLPHFDEVWDQPDRREELLWVVRSVESEATMIGASGHILGVARRGVSG